MNRIDKHLLTETFEQQRKELQNTAARHRKSLPLRYLRQQAHFTTPAGNHEIILKAVEHGTAAGPAMLAYESALPESRLQEEIARIERFAESVKLERGTTMIGGVMTARAMDRHSRAVLRKAVAWGKLTPVHALQLRIITLSEFQTLQ